MLYPFIMKPYYKDYIWGGTNLEKYGKRLPGSQVAESWEVSARPEGESIIANGRWSGNRLTELIKRFPDTILGTSVNTGQNDVFPLLFKLIDAKESLSVQVHPGDDYARSNEHEQFGKHEAWYILEAAPDAKIVYGLAIGTSKERLKKMIAENRIDDVLNSVSVQRGAVIDIPPGTVHALGKGIMLAEIQQNSNLTYRIYDYDRKDREGKPRELHIGKALDVIDYSFPASFVSGELLYKTKASTITKLLRNRYFELDIVETDGTLELNADGSRFFILFIESGSACISYSCGELLAKAGETLLIPACLGKFTVAGKSRMLKMYVPND